LMLSFTF